MRKFSATRNRFCQRLPGRQLKTRNGIESIDHPVVAVNDLGQAREIYERLGFTVPPRGSHIEWGTGNLCIMFPHDYLEMRGIIDASRFTMHLDSHLDNFGEGLMGVAFGTTDVKSSIGEAVMHGIDTGELRRLTRNFEHPEGWTQPSFELYAPAAADIEGLMHVVVIQHLTPELIRRPDFLEHANGCTSVVSIAGTIYDIERCALKMQRLLGKEAVESSERGVFLRIPSGQSIELLLPDIFVRDYGEIEATPDPETPRLGAMTLCVSKLENTARFLTDNDVAFTQPGIDMIRVASDLTCGVTLQFVENKAT